MPSMNTPEARDDVVGDGLALVLLVDDTPDNLAVLHDALDESGYTVLVATSGEQALQSARAALPDIVLLDAVMPGIDGFEVARRLKADEATAAIPIVFMTGLTETEHDISAFGAGGVDYVTKPVRVGCLWPRDPGRARTRRPPPVANGAGAHADGAALSRRARRRDAAASDGLGGA